MPWKESNVMEKRLEFVMDWRREQWSMSHLCATYEVSRNTGYKWMAR